MRPSGCARRSRPLGSAGHRDPNSRRVGPRGASVPSRGDASSSRASGSLRNALPSAERVCWGGGGQSASPPPRFLSFRHWALPAPGGALGLPGAQGALSPRRPPGDGSAAPLRALRPEERAGRPGRLRVQRCGDIPGVPWPLQQPRMFPSRGGSPRGACFVMASEGRGQGPPSLSGSGPLFSLPWGRDLGRQRSDRPRE